MRHRLWQAQIGLLLREPRPVRTHDGCRSWRGLPVFSAWVTQPEDADDPASPA
jgi:hypothetical protein